MARGTKVVWKDKGWQVMLKRVTKPDPKVVVGIVGSKADEIHDEQSGLTFAQVATIQEFGTKDDHIPARPFLRTALVWGAEAAIKRVMAKVARNVILGTHKNIAVREAGRWAVRRVQHTMRSRVFVPNAEATKLRKGNDFTLRDSYELVKAIGFEVVTGFLGLGERFSE